ncbi:MAG: DUF2339 domain-containing protein [Fimbriimonas sp.]|nr:DUF2339 domain-containing protein [Fimbriimonas sp.]
MPEQEIGPVLTRLEIVERSLQNLTQRVYALESSAHGAATAVVAPPPVRIPMPAQPVTPPASDTRPEVTSMARETLGVHKPVWYPPATQVAPAPMTAKDVDDLEYKIGLTGLLRGGAAVIVIAIVYLVALAVSRGYITPQVQFAGEIALCMAFIGIGFVKRDEREEFGQLMTGIGSCGLYLSFAGAHLYKHLYSGEMLVGLFVALSFANFAFALWRSSRSFLIIGMIGGLTAAMLPMHRYKPMLDVELHFLILVPAALIVVKNRWKEMAVALWAASTAALIPALTYDAVWMVRIGALYGSSLICAATYALVWKETEFDAVCAFSGLMVVAAGIGALTFDSVSHGSLHVLVLAGVSAGIGLGFRHNLKVRNAFLLSSLLVAASMAPVGFHRVESAIAFGLLSIAIALASLRFGGKAVAAVSAVELALGLCAYTAPWVTTNAHFSLASESGMLATFMAAAIACTYASHRAGALSEGSMFAALILVSPMFSRLGLVLLTAPGVHWRDSMAILAPFVILTFGILAIGRSSQWRSSIVLGWVGLFICVCQYFQMIGEEPISNMFDSLFLATLIGATVLAGNAARKWAGKDSFDTLVGTCSALVAIFAVRLSIVWLRSPGIGWTYPMAIVTGLLFVVLVGVAITKWSGWRGVLPIVWCAMLGSGMISTVIRDLAPLSYAMETIFLIANIVALLAVAKTTSDITKERTLLTAVSVVGIWFLFSKLGYRVLTGVAIGMKDAPALSLSWTIYAIALVTLGFAFSARYLRFWSFGVFGTTLAKVFLVDLSGLDPGIRVLTLMVLGLGMVGTGYWYISHRPTTELPFSDDHMPNGTGSP